MRPGRTAPIARGSRRAITTAVVALGAGLLLVGPSAEASVAVDQSYRVPKSGTLTLHGHGFGHGHGMSQYGAWGAARRGHTYGGILGFYYPGTSWGRVGGKLRVLISGDTSDDVVVSPALGLRVHDYGSGKTYRLPDIDGVRRWGLAVHGTRTGISYLTTRWHRYAPGGATVLTGTAQIGADEPMTLWTPSGSRTYRGSLRSAPPARGSADRDTVNVVSADDYVRGVVPSEMPPSWSREALRAQAVAARTYATWSRDQRADRSWQICDTSACQVYRGLDAEYASTNAAVSATAGRIRTYGGKAAFTQFSSSSGGWLSAGSAPYLVAKSDPYDDFSANPVHDWTLKLKAARVQAAYPSLGRLVRLKVTRREGHGQWGGRVVTMVLDGTKRNVTVSGNEFRSRFGLRSTWFAG